MISIQTLREHNEKLRLAVDAHVGLKSGAGDWVYALSGWQPQPHEKAAAFAETAAHALILFKTRQTEFIYRARQLLGQLLSLQEESGLFPRYLHESGVKDCAVSSYRIYLVMMALLKWHPMAVGADLLEEIESSLLKMKQNKVFEALLLDVLKGSSLEEGVMPAWMARALLGSHVLESTINSHWSKAVAYVEGSLGLQWLQKPKGILPDESCWLDIWRELYLGSLSTKLELSHIWTALLHIEGPSIPFESVKGELKPVALFRSLPLARERRAKSESCFLSMQMKNEMRVRCFADHAAVSGSNDSFKVNYEAENGLVADENHPWIEIKINKCQLWNFESEIFSAVKMTAHQPLVLSFGKGELKIAIYSENDGYWKQKPSLAKDGIRNGQVLYFVPRDVKAKMDLKIKWEIE